MTEKNEQRSGFVNLRQEMTSVGKNSGVYLIGYALSRAVGFFMIPIYTRYIAPTNYGAMELIEIVTACVTMLVSMGASEAMSRFYYAEKTEEKRNQVVSTTIVGVSLIGLFFILFFLLISGTISEIVIGEAQYQYYLEVALLACWFAMLCEFGYSYLRMLYKAKLFVVISMAQLLIALLLNIWFVVFCKLNILGIFYSTLIVESLIGSLLSVMILRKTGVHLSLLVLKRIVSFGLPLVPARIGMFLGFVSNRFFLRWYGSSDPVTALSLVGLYSLGHKFAVIINRFVSAPFNSYWGPRRLELVLKDEPGARLAVARVCTYATLLTIYIALFLSVGIESVIDIMADLSYYGAHKVVPILALGYVALGLETHFTTGILCTRQTIWSTYTSVASLAVTLAWNYIFVPRYGLIGAASSLLAGFSVRIVMLYFVSQHFFRIPFEVKRICILFLTAFVMYWVSKEIVLSSTYLTFIARIGCAGLFPLAILAFGFYHRTEIAYFFQGIQKAGSTMRAWCQ